MTHESKFSNWVEDEMRDVVRDIRKNNLTPAKGAVIVKAVDTAVKDKIRQLHEQKFEYVTAHNALPEPAAAPVIETRASE